MMKKQVEGNAVRREAKLSMNGVKVAFLASTVIAAIMHGLGAEVTIIVAIHVR